MFKYELSVDINFDDTELEEVVSISKSDPNKYSLHTTRSWEFSGLEEDEGLGRSAKNLFGMSGDLLNKARYGEDVIVGLLDSGN